MILNGLVEEWEYDQISIDGDILGDNWDWDGFKDKKVSVRYFVSNAPLVDIESAEEGLIRTILGALEADAYPLCGSEWTGHYGFEQSLMVGGHDLLEEMRSYVGKYVLIEVSTDEDETR